MLIFGTLIPIIFFQEKNEEELQLATIHITDMKKESQRLKR